MEMVSVAHAENIIGDYKKDYGTEQVYLAEALGRILAEDLLADRDLPPFNRATVDGIAVQYTALMTGVDRFDVVGVQAAGMTPIRITSQDQCVEIMTGAAVDASLDAVVRYEDCKIENGRATLLPGLMIAAGQNIHPEGKDKNRGDLLVDKNRVVTAAVIGLAASIGKTSLLVKKLPKIAVISTGDEMIPPDQSPTPYQLRRSNGVVIQAALVKYKVSVDLYHLNDDPKEINEALEGYLKSYDVLLMTGGVSKGKFDFVPEALEKLGVVKGFHKVRQRPGKPFWFGGSQAEKLVFAFPGNPVAVFMCLHRYFVPWLKQSLGIDAHCFSIATLTKDVVFNAPLQYFVQVKLTINAEGILIATPFETNGSGDFSNLVYADAFMELPVGPGVFKKGDRFKVWRYDW
jgi:molybdopterin molybdotransferase